MSDPTLTLLVVDDEPQIRRLLHNAVTDGPLLDAAEGAATVRVLEAATGRQGIDLAAAEAPALVVLDLGLPDMAGVDVCREIRRWSTAPIIVLSARHAEPVKINALDAGADDYITKPFAMGELLARLRVALRHGTRGEDRGLHTSSRLPRSRGP